MSEEAVESEHDYRRSKRNRIGNRQYQDYELYVTMEEQEDRPDHEEDDPKKMVSVVHYVMMHYAEKESIKKKLKACQYGLEAGLKHFGEKGETVVSKELAQFNVYDVFEPL